MKSWETMTDEELVRRARLWDKVWAVIGWIVGIVCYIIAVIIGSFAGTLLRMWCEFKGWV